MTQEEFRTKIVREFQSSGLKKREFCQRKQISVSTLYIWQCRVQGALKNQPLTNKNFIPVEVLPSSSEQDDDKIVIKTNRGHTIEVPISISSEKISNILTVLI